MSPAHHKHLIANMVQDVFKDIMLQFTDKVRAVTLKNLWALGVQVIVFYPREV